MIVNQVKCLPNVRFGLMASNMYAARGRDEDKVSNVNSGFAPDLAPVFLLSQWKYEFKAGATGVCL